MALSLTMTDALRLKPGMRVASMGYPDLVAPLDMLERAFGSMDGAEYRADSEAICKRHGLEPRKIPDAHFLFAKAGCRLDVYDIIKERGCEILCDLNFEMAQTVGYDIVLDVGTSEHCFNIAQALMNMAGMVNEGGVIIHENPFNWGNHGFYNLNPTWYADFYEANGFEVMDCRLASRDGRGAAVPHGSRFKFTAEEVNVFAMARRVEVRPFVFPVQRKYVHLIPAAEVPGDLKREVVNG